MKKFKYSKIIVSVFFGSICNMAFSDSAAIIADCENCHGKNGVSSDPDVPTVAGYSGYYMAESLLMYKEKQRPCPEISYITGDKKGTKTTMCEAVGALEEKQIEDVAEHYAGKPFVRAKQAFDTALAKKGEVLHDLHCVKCHEDGGSSPDDDAGMLAGQWSPFLKVQLQEYRDGKRPMDEKMKPKMDELKDADFEALLHYYASFQ